MRMKHLKIYTFSFLLLSCMFISYKSAYGSNFSLPDPRFHVPSVGMTLPGNACVKMDRISARTGNKTNVPLNADKEYLIDSGYNEKDTDDNVFNFICYSNPDSPAFQIKEVFGLTGDGWNGYGIFTINGTYDEKNKYKYGVPCQNYPLYHSTYGMQSEEGNCDRGQWVIPIQDTQTNEEGFYSGYRRRRPEAPGPGPNITVPGDWQYINMYSIYKYNQTKTATSTLTHKYISPPKPDLNGAVIALKGYDEFYPYDESGQHKLIISSNSEDKWYRVGTPNNPKYSGPIRVYAGIKSEDMHKLIDAGYDCEFKIAPSRGTGRTLEGIGLSDLIYSLDSYPGVSFGSWGGDQVAPYWYNYIPDEHSNLNLTLTVNCKSSEQYPNDPIAFNPKTLNLYIVKHF